MFTEKAAQMRRERAIDKFITLSSVVDDGIVMSRNSSPRFALKGFLLRRPTMSFSTDVPTS
jgi:hypothetical protein